MSREIVEQNVVWLREYNVPQLRDESAESYSQRIRAIRWDLINNFVAGRDSMREASKEEKK